METATVEVWVLVDESGDYVCSHDPEVLHEVYDEHVGEDYRNTLNLRRIKVTLTVPLPKPIELTGTVPAEQTEGTLKLA